VARLGGDEFVVLLGRVERTVEALQIAERIRRALSLPVEIGSHEVVVSASIGVAMAGGGYRDQEEILRDADTAMYRAKAKGFGAIVVFDPAMHREAVAQLEVENELRRAIDRGELRHHYQAIYRLPDGELAGYEMLLRWEHPERGLLLPADFLDVAEESGLIFDLDRWSLAEAARQARAIDSGVPISVNLFSGMLLDPDLAPRIEELCREHGIGGGALRLEITEGAFLERKEVGAAVLGHLRSIGVGVDLDDFGTGYSSLGYLRQLPLDRLKIDRSFVAALSGEGGKPGIARTVIDLAHSLGLRVVAEGVESPQHLAELARFGCDFAQGFLLGRPLPVEAIDWATGCEISSGGRRILASDAAREGA
jgi:predicted signal transduction protein with EAL and GGDEF domain